MTTLTALKLHPLSQIVLEKATQVQRLIEGTSSTDHDKREPDEHEFFIIKTGFAMTHVLNCCQQLDNIPVLLATHHQTAMMNRKGINRHSMIVYHLENYVIRTQTLVDRMLKLVDAVFHLLNDPRSCRFDVVMRNVKVQVSELPESMKALRRVVERYSSVRNDIIHHRSMWSLDLWLLEGKILMQRLHREDQATQHSSIDQDVKDWISEVIYSRKAELLAFNDELAVAINLIFDKLAPYYRREEAALLLRLSTFDGQS